nr:protein PHYTOCHROME KINASE SUBSTRATE 3-like [Ipomoea batatas]
MEGQDLSLRVASFSCYLNPEDSFVQKIWAGSSNLKISKTNNAVPDGLRVKNHNNFTFNSSRPVQDPTVAFILPQQPHNPKPSKKDAEVSRIFKADKYFNNTTTVPGGIKYANPQSQGGDYFKSATASMCSESSSQMALLPNIIKHNKKGIGRRLFLGFIGCRGPCSDKKAVFISHSKGMEHFATNSGHLREEENGEPRKSLEVFGSDKKGGVAGNLERKLSMLTWDAIPNTPQNINPPMTTPIATISNTICDDRASDASSDLFEIEDISSTAGHGYGACRTAGYTSGCSSPTHYAPSEASIQWSVVTASAADYASDYCDENIKCNSIAVPRTVAKANNIVTAKSSLKGRSSGGLLGCNSYKAVSVAESVAKTADHQLPRLGNHTQLSYARSAKVLPFVDADLRIVGEDEVYSLSRSTPRRRLPCFRSVFFAQRRIRITVEKMNLPLLCSSYSIQIRVDNDPSLVNHVENEQVQFSGDEYSHYSDEEADLGSSHEDGDYDLERSRQDEVDFVDVECRNAENNDEEI